MARNVLYQRKQPDLSGYVQASIDAVNGTPDSTTGHFGVLHYTGCETRERAEEIKRALYRAAGYLKVSMSAQVKKTGSEFTVEFRAIDKAMARAYIIQKYGPDRSKWPYSPRKGDGNYG